MMKPGSSVLRTTVCIARHCAKHSVRPSFGEVGGVATPKRTTSAKRRETVSAGLGSGSHRFALPCFYLEGARAGNGERKAERQELSRNLHIPELGLVQVSPTTGSWRRGAGRVGLAEWQCSKNKVSALNFTRCTAALLYDILRAQCGVTSTCAGSSPVVFQEGDCETDNTNTETKPPGSFPDSRESLQRKRD